jgi:hypothetical protein
VDYMGMRRRGQLTLEILLDDVAVAISSRKSCAIGRSTSHAISVLRSTRVHKRRNGGSG